MTSRSSMIDYRVLEESMLAYGLTEREREVCRLALTGACYKRITYLTYCEVQTFKNHLTRVYRKAGVPTEHAGNGSGINRVRLLRVLLGLPAVEVT